jgi:hypothetical protein
MISQFTPRSISSGLISIPNSAAKERIFISTSPASAEASDMFHDFSASRSSRIS